MTSSALHEAPKVGAIIRQQFKSTALSLRIPALIAAAITVVVTFLVLADFFNGRGGIEFAPSLSMIPGFAGIILAGVAWYGERRSGAGFLWTLPVDRTRHALAKTFAGWLLLMLGVFGFMAWLLLLALITKGNITGDEVIKLLPTPDIPSSTMLDPSTLRTITWIPQKWLWLTPFTAATGTYVITSAYAIGIRHPFRWILAALAAAFLAGAVMQGIGSQSLWAKSGNLMETINEGRYGIDALLTARSESLHTTVNLTNGTRVAVWRGLPVASDWIIGTLLWTGLGIAGLTAALFRNRELR